MKNFQYLITLLFLTTFYSCGIGEWDVSELYAQKIEGTSKILYKYDAWGGRDSHAFGYIILDSTEIFKVNVLNNLPFYQLQEIPNKKNIIGISDQCYNSCGENYYITKPIFSPLKKEKSNNKNFEIIHNIYQTRGFEDKSAGLQTYEFESFKETRDSLFFYNLNDIETVYKGHLDSLKIKKIDIVIKGNKNNEIYKIVIEDLQLNEIKNEIISHRTYFLTPKNIMASNLFSNYGIFKDVNK